MIWQQKLLTILLIKINKVTIISFKIKIMEIDKIEMLKRLDTYDINLMKKINELIGEINRLKNKVKELEERK